ncbi:hypothetical protein BT96DRAFT_754853, partial [Gymnopus androsaceus JB14]
TGNMSTHAKRCWGKDTVTAVKDSTLDKAQAAIKKVRRKKKSKQNSPLPSRHSRGGLKGSLRNLLKKKLPGLFPHFLQCYVRKLYSKTKERLAEELQVIDGKLPIAIDHWMSPNHHVFMSIVIVWLRKLDNGEEELTTTILDFIELPCSHSAENMAEVLAKVLKEYGIDGKV